MNKVTDEEFQEIQALRDSFIEVITATGELHLGKVVLEQQLKETDEELRVQELKFAEIQDKERVLLEKFKQKYGTGNINMETGEITV